MRAKQDDRSAAADTQGEPVVETAAEQAWNKTLEQVVLMQRSNPQGWVAALSAVDFLAIEDQARKARSAYIAKHTRLLALKLARTLEHLVGQAYAALRLSVAKPIKH